MSPDQWLDSIAPSAFHRAVLSWYDKHGRELPWRDTRDPYRIWVSEIMLQQTLVATVIEYYDAFLRRFPTVKKLAVASESDVLHAWQGLGYYRRARHMHQAAQQIVRDHNGKFPAEIDAIRALPGLGRYTASAVACFAFHQKRPILEANTRRLWSRLMGSPNDAKQTRHTEALWQIADAILPDRRVADFNQALMDLGSQICLPKQPLCPKCPLKAHCQAFQRGNVERFTSAPKTPLTEVSHVCVAIWDSEHQPCRRLLMTKRPLNAQWPGLWELPRVERKPRESWKAAANRALREAGVEHALVLDHFCTHRHAITRYRVTLRCYRARLLHPRNPNSGRIGSRRWIRPQDVADLPLSSPQRIVIQRLFSSDLADAKTSRK